MTDVLTRLSNALLSKTEDKQGFSKLLFTDCESVSFSHNVLGSTTVPPRGGNLAVSHIFIVTLQMESLYYKPFHR